MRLDKNNSCPIAIRFPPQPMDHRDTSCCESLIAFLSSGSSSCIYESLIAEGHSPCTFVIVIWLHDNVV